MNLSVNQYQMLRSVCLPYGVVFPPRNRIDVVKRAFHPPITSFQMKSSVEITVLLEETAASLIKLYSTEQGATYYLFGKFGVDGTGSHKVRRQLIETTLAASETAYLDPNKCNSFLLSCYVLLELHQDGTVI